MSLWGLCCLMSVCIIVFAFLIKNFVYSTLDESVVFVVRCNKKVDIWEDRKVCEILAIPLSLDSKCIIELIKLSMYIVIARNLKKSEYLSIKALKVVLVFESNNTGFKKISSFDYYSTRSFHTWRFKLIQSELTDVY